MFLYEVPDNSPLRVETKEGVQDAVFVHIDGMYSLCHLKDDPDAYFHLSASTPMKQCPDGVYEIDQPKQEPHAI